MVKKKGPAWNFFKQKNKGVECKYCSIVYKHSNVNKMTKHIKKCFKCPADMKKILDSCDSLKTALSTSKKEREEKVGLLTVTEPEPSSSSSQVSSVSSKFYALTQKEDECEPQQSSSTFSTQRSLDLKSFVDHMDVQTNEALNQSLAKAIFISGSPLSMVEHPLWISFFKKIRPSFIPPSRYRIASTYLDAQYTEMQTEVTNLLQESKNLYLQCDGWSNLKNESIINFVVSKPEPLFVDFVMTKNNRHNAPYLAGLIINIIEKHGYEKFFVIIGDNAKNVKAALTLVKEKYPSIVTLGCLAHLLHLLCGDILGCMTVKNFMANVIEVIKTIKNSHILQALFNNIQSEKKFKDRISLKLPGKTRWGSHLFCLQSFLSNKSVLQKLAVSEEADLVSDMKRRLLDDSVFWVRVQNMHNILKPIVDMITSIETNTPLIHKIYSKFNELERILNEEIPKSPLQKIEEKKILAKFLERKEFGISEIHLAADLLNPAAQGITLSPTELIDAISFVCEIGQQMGFDVVKIRENLADYRDKEGIWRRPLIWNGVSENELSPLLWWRSLRGTCILADVAIRILGAPVTSAATERTFSTFSWIHSKKRNRLTTERAAKLTYLSHNWKLLNNDRFKPSEKEKDSNSVSKQRELQTSQEDTDDEDMTTTTEEESNDSDSN